MTPWTVARQAPLPMGFPRQEYWSELPFPPPGALPNRGIEPVSSALAGRFFTTEHQGSPRVLFDLQFIHPVFLRSVFLAFVLNLYIALVSTLISFPPQYLFWLLWLYQVTKLPKSLTLPFTAAHDFKRKFQGCGFYYSCLKRSFWLCREALSVCFKAMQTSSAIESCVVLPDFRALFLDLLQEPVYANVWNCLLCSLVLFSGYINNVCSLREFGR